MRHRAQALPRRIPSRRGRRGSQGRADTVLRPRAAPKIMYPLVLDLAADRIPVAVACRVLRFSKQAFYKWREELVSQRDWDDAHLINAALDIHADDPEFGYRFIADDLADSRFRGRGEQGPAFVRAAGHLQRIRQETRPDLPARPTGPRRPGSPRFRRHRMLARPTSQETHRRPHCSARSAMTRKHTSRRSSRRRPTC